MSLRVHHLACLFVLLSSLGVAQNTASPKAPATFCGRYIDVLLYRQAAERQIAAQAETRASRKRDPEATLALEPASRSLYRVAWMMRPAAAHAASVQAETSWPTAVLL